MHIFAIYHFNVMEFDAAGQVKPGLPRDCNLNISHTADQRNGESRLRNTNYFVSILISRLFQVSDFYISLISARYPNCIIRYPKFIHLTSLPHQVPDRTTARRRRTRTRTCTQLHC